MPLGWLRKLNPYYHRAYVRELLATRASDGPYRFLVKNWARASDFDLTRQVLSTDLLHGTLEPLPLPLQEVERALVLAPHQDDETIGCGGTLLRLGDNGASLHVAFVTDGAQTGGKADAATREREARRVCDDLGATYYSLGLSGPDPSPSESTVQTLSELLLEVRPDVILAPWILDLPPAHRLTNDLLSMALAREAPPKTEIWGYQVEAGIVPNGYVDTGAVMERKLNLVRHYGSQLSVQAYEHMTRGRDAWNSRVLPSSPEPRYAELFFALPAPAWRNLFESTCAQDLGTYYRGRSRLAERMLTLRGLS